MLEAFSNLDVLRLSFGEATDGSINVKYDVILPENTQITANDVDNAIASLQVTGPPAGIGVDPDPSRTSTRGDKVFFFFVCLFVFFCFVLFLFVFC